MTEVTAVPLRPIRKGAVARLWISIGAALLVAAGLAWVGTAGSVARNGTNEQFLAWHKGRQGIVTTPSGLQYQVLKAGEGPTPTDADVVLVNYKGSLRDGTVFDQAERAPFPVQGVVPGFGEGLKLMQRGGKYRLWIPAALGYGPASPDPKIPANSLLVFDVDLIDFKSQAEIQAQMQALQAQQAQGALPGGPPHP